MSDTSFIVIQVCAVLIVVLQPILGWEAIPRFFNYSTGSAILLALVDTAILLTPAFLWRLA